MVAHRACKETDVLVGVWFTGGREKLTEEERQVKKAEAARRRKQLVEKTAKEIQV